MTLPEKILQKFIERDQIPHALLFVGGKKAQEGAVQFAKSALLEHHPESAKKIENGHPDLHFFRPEGKTGMHSIEQIHKLGKEVAFNCSEARYKFLVVEEAERCLPTSSNALLKTLEEPVSHSILILVTDKPEKLLPTIVSRCQKIFFHEEKKHQPTELQNRFLAYLMNGFSERDVENMAKEIDQGRKEWEKKKMKDLPKDISLQTRENFEREIEAASLLEFQAQAFSLLETFLFWARDVTLVKMGVTSRLHYSDHVEKLRLAKPFVFEHVEKMVAKIKLAIERQTPLQSCLEALLIRFGYL